MYPKRIVITGMGLLVPGSDEPDHFIHNLLDGKSGITRMETVDTSRIRCKIGGDLGLYDIKGALGQLEGKMEEGSFKRLKKIFRTAPFATRFSLITAIRAWLDADFKNGPDSERIACITGGHNYQDRFIVDNVKRFFMEDPEYIDALMGIVVFDTDIAASISEVIGIHGPVYNVGGTCTSSGIALKCAINEILLNDCDAAIIGGGLMDYSQVGYQALSLINAISYVSFNDSPEKASRPYDIRREGFVPSHGCGMVVVETLEHALKRGARIYAEVLAVESSSDANHLSNPSVEGQVALMEKAIRKAGIHKEDIRYINAHATSTPMGDLVEIKSIASLFAASKDQLKVNATKSMIGHTGWCSNTVEMIAGILQMKHKTLHPSINIEELDPAIAELGIDVCANRKVDNWDFQYFLKNSFGFGGFNCSTVIKRWNGDS